MLQQQANSIIGKALYMRNMRWVLKRFLFNSNITRSFGEHENTKGYSNYVVGSNKNKNSR